MKKIKQFISLVLIFIMVVSQAGCAVKDAVEINRREYIFAVGIDINENSTGDNDKYIFTAEIPILNSKSEEKKYIVTQSCSNLISFYNDNMLTTNKIASDSIMQVIVIGEKVLTDATTMKMLIDEIERSPLVNRKVKLVVAKGAAADVINFKLDDNILVGRYISEFLIKLKKLSIQTTYSFDEIVLYLQSFGNTLIPSICIDNNRLSIDGAAIIKDYELKAYLDHNENGIITILTRGAASSMGDINILVDNTPVSLTYENVIVSQNVDLRDDRLSVKFYITLYLNINSYTTAKNNSSTAEFEAKLCNKANLTITEKTNKLIYKIQKQYQTDILGIQEDLIKYNNTGYNKIVDKYDEIFQNADINVYYNIKINNSGMVK